MVWIVSGSSVRVVISRSNMTTRSEWICSVSRTDGGLQRFANVVHSLWSYTEGLAGPEIHPFAKFPVRQTFSRRKRSRFIISASWQSRRWKVVRSVRKAQRFYAERSDEAALRASLPGVLALWSAAGCHRVAIGAPRRGCCLPVGALSRLREFSQGLASPSGASPGNTPLPIGWRSLSLDPIDAKQVSHGCLLTK